jgi:hypothetical protein
VSQVVVAGTGSPGSVDAVGTSASFNGPHGMSTSPDGSFVLIADYGNHKIRKLIVSTGVVSTFAGSGSTGGGNGVGTAAALYNPIDIAISSDGSIAVSTCHFGHRIRHIVMSTALVTTLAGDGVAGSTNGVGTNAQFNNLVGVSLSNIDNTFALIADFDNRMIRKIVLSTKVVTRVAGSGTAGAANGIGTLATMNRPHFIAISTDDAFAVISEFGGHRIRKLVLSTWAVTTVAGSPTSATGAGDGVGTLASFNIPGGVLLTSDDLIVYVADHVNHKIRRVELSSRRVSTVVAALGSVALNAPVGLTWIAADQRLMVSSFGSHLLHEMYGTCAAPTGQPTGEPTSAPTIYRAPEGLFCDTVSQVVVAGTGSAGSVDAVGTSALFYVPGGMSTSPDGSFVLIADISNHKIRKLIVSTGVVSTFAGSGSGR